jgi:DNA-directed RNA polymerase specialized sigma24 family protein
MEDALLVRACHMRAIDLGRRLAGAQGARPRSDVYDERNYNAGRVEVLRLDGLRDWDDGDQEQALFGWAEPDAISPARMLASAVDLERWLGQLDPADRLLLALRQAGHTQGGIGAAMGRSTSAVFKRLRELGQELAKVAGVEVETGRAA